MRVGGRCSTGSVGARPARIPDSAAASSQFTKRTLSGICGWFGLAGGDPRAVIGAMRQRLAWRSAEADAIAVGARHALAAVGPRGTTAILVVGPISVAVQGHPHWRATVEAAPGSTTTSLDRFCQRV